MLDDLGKDRLVLSTHLKNWADRYPFTAETKGGGKTIRPRRVVVTSNYHPSSLFEDQETIAAIERRFKIEFMPKKELPPILRVEPPSLISSDDKINNFMK